MFNEGSQLPSRVDDVVETSDRDAFREALSRRIAPHDLQISGRTPIAARYRGARFGAVSLFQVGYGAEAHIAADGCGDYFLVKMPAVGAARIRSNGAEVVTGPTRAAVLNPDRTLTFDYGIDSEQVVLGVDAGLLRRRCAELLDQPGLLPRLSFDLEFPLDTAAGQRWLALLGYLRSEAARTPNAARSLVLAPLEQLVVSTLLEVQAHSLSAALTGPVSPAAPAYVRRAEAYMEAHLEEPLTPAQVAANAGASERALYRGFQEFRGMSLMARLRALRLERVRDELLAGEPGDVSVTDAALRWGFNHLGHFGQAYRAAYGETPQETLRRRPH